MKRLVLGDIHGHYDTVKGIYDLEQPDEVVVLGDYFDNFHGTDGQILDCFDDLVALQERHTLTKGLFTMIIGNHDYHYLWYGERYSGYRLSYAIEARERLSRHCYSRGMMQWVMVDHVNRTIYSHAGVSAVWMQENGIATPDDINEAHTRAFKFSNYCEDNYGDSVYSSPIWIRPRALSTAMYRDQDGVWTQIVGHTQTMTPRIETDGETGRECLYTIDCLPRYYMVEILDDCRMLQSRDIMKYEQS